MPDVVKALLGSAGTPIGHPRVISGYISLNQPAPATFNDLVFVIAEDHSEDRPYGPMAWPAIHGSTMPVKGDPAVFAMDQNNTPTLLWWGTGSTAFAGTSPTGTAGGVLSGSYPNPGMDTGAASSNVGTLGGDLSGSLPNPALATGIVLELSVTGTTRKVALGTVTLTWAGALSFSGNQTITHGLGTTPTQVLLGSQFMSASPFAFEPFVNSALGSTTFVLAGLTPGVTPVNGTTGVAWWAAIG